MAEKLSKLEEIKKFAYSTPPWSRPIKARNYLKWLIARVEELEKENERLKNELGWTL